MWQHLKCGTNKMTTAKFIDNITINVIAKDGESFTLEAFLPVHQKQQPFIEESLVKYFEECFSDDKSSMVYWVLMKMTGQLGFSFSYIGSDRAEERQRIGSRIKELRELKSIEAKQLAILAKIDPANLSRIENGKYSIGLDVLSRIAYVLGAKVDLV